MSFDATEKYQSQIPALQLLVALGFKPLSGAEALALRGGRLRNVILDEVLTDQLLGLNRFTHRGRDYAFDLEDAHEAIRRLKPTPDRLKGLRGTNQDIYDTLVLGTTIVKTIDGDSKSYSFRYVDWENPDNNAYHVTAEMAVERTGSTQTRRCDIVAFVNGIPFVVIENKRPTESLKKADSQLLGYQHEDNIPQLFYFAQVLLSMNRREARYATVGTPRKFWQTWREEDADGRLASLAAREPNAAERAALAGALEDDTPTAERPSVRLQGLIDRPLAVAEAQAVYAGAFVGARSHFDDLVAEGERAITAQDRVLSLRCVGPSACSTWCGVSRSSIAACARSPATSSSSVSAAPWNGSSSMTRTAAVRAALSGTLRVPANR